MNRVLIAAVRGEVLPLVRSWAALETVDRVAGWKHPHGDVYVLYSGMGPRAATRAFRRALQLCSPDEVCSVGWSGALLEAQQPADVIVPSSVRDLSTGEQFACWQTPSLAANGELLTSTLIANRPAKERLAAAYPAALAVEMEAATVARLCLAHGIPFRALRVISDALAEDLPEMNRYLSEDGRFDTVRFALRSLLSPGRLPVLIRFGRNSQAAARALCSVLAREFTSLGQGTASL